LSTGPSLLEKESAGSGTTANMVAIEFLPTGSLNLGSMSSSRIYLLLAVGRYDGTSLISNGSDISNWAQIRIASATGSISFARP